MTDRDGLNKLFMLGLENKDGMVVVRFPNNGGYMTLTPADARKFAAALVTQADHAEA